MENNELQKLLGSILFVSGRPVTLKDLEKTTGAKGEAIKSAIADLQTLLSQSGVVVLENRNSYLMSSDPKNSDIIKSFLNIELREKLTDAAIETLAIIAYKQPIPKHEIEAIRGVNSQYTLRLLMMRGLVERVASAKDGRMNLYQTTHEFLQHMGIKNPKELPDFGEITKDIKAPEDLTNPSGTAINQ